MFLRTISVVFTLALAFYVANVPLSSTDEPTKAQFNSERIYETVKGRDAVISLERNSKGEVVVNTVKFVNGST